MDLDRKNSLNDDFFDIQKKKKKNAIFNYLISLIMTAYKIFFKLICINLYLFVRIKFNYKNFS